MNVKKNKKLPWEKNPDIMIDLIKLIMKNHIC